jgi:hypothetical protein
MAIIGQGISLRGMTHEKFHYPFYLKSGTLAADVGKAVSMDSSAANSVKLAEDGDILTGALVTREDRAVEGVLVGTVALRGGFTFTEKDSPTYAIALGDSVVGAGGGKVKARENADGTAKEPNLTDNIVVEVVGDQITIITR